MLRIKGFQTHLQATRAQNITIPLYLRDLFLTRQFRTRSNHRKVIKMLSNLPIELRQEIFFLAILASGEPISFDSGRDIEAAATNLMDVSQQTLHDIVPIIKRLHDLYTDLEAESAAKCNHLQAKYEKLSWLRLSNRGTEPYDTAEEKLQAAEDIADMYMFCIQKTDEMKDQAKLRFDVLARFKRGEYSVTIGGVKLDVRKLKSAARAEVRRQVPGAQNDVKKDE